jgi:hypothetical protein
LISTLKKEIKDKIRRHTLYRQEVLQRKYDIYFLPSVSEYIMRLERVKNNNFKMY